MSYQSEKPIPLAGGMKLRNGQIISSAETIAAKSTRSKDGAISVHPGMRDRTAEAPPWYRTSLPVAKRSRRKSTRAASFRWKMRSGAYRFGMTGGSRGKPLG